MTVETQAPVGGQRQDIHQPARAGQRHPRAFHGRGAEGQLRPSRRPHGHGRHRRSPVERLPQAQPGAPEVGGSRPLRAVQRPRLDAALFAAAPDRLRPADGGNQEFPPAPFQDPGPSRIRLRARRRDHHRPAGPGHHQRRGHGHRREGAGRPVQPRRSSHRRSLYLCIPRRRLPDGRHLARGLLAGRHAGPGQADRVLRRQRHLDRRPRRGLVHRQYPEAFRGLRLARGARRRRPQPGLHPQGHPGGALGQRQAVHDLLQDRHRLRRAQPVRQP